MMNTAFRAWLAAAFSLSLVLGAAAQEKSNATVDAIFADLARPGSPGCALAVARGGKILYEKGYGLANLEENVPITPRTVFDIGSTSKQFAAASILLLEKQGQLSVNDDIRKYLPEIPDYGHKITILNLLNHTSGLRDYLALFEMAGINVDNVTTDNDALAVIARQKSLNFAPGSQWLYSNSGFFLLSIIVERVSGKNLREFAAANIFTPLGMAQTTYRNTHTQLVANRGLAYDPPAKDHPERGFTLDVSYFEQTGDGAVHTSVEDLLKWDENFYSAKIGGKEFLAEMQEPAKLNDGKALHYAKGLVVDSYRGLPAVSHGGSWGGYRAQLLRFPQQHFSVVCLCNLANAGPGDRALKVADIFLKSEFKEAKSKEKPDDDGAPPAKKPTLAVSADTLAQYTGDYASDELAATYTLAIESGKLVLRSIRPGNGFIQKKVQTELRPTGKEEFLADDLEATFTFERDTSGNVKGFSLSAERSSGIAFQKK